MLYLALLAMGQVLLQDEGGTKTRVTTLNCVGAGINCTVSSTTGTLNVTGGDGGSTGPGGSPPQVQWNNSGVFGGVVNVGSDGTREIFTSEQSVPGITVNYSTGFDYSQGAGMPQWPSRVDSALKLPVATGGMPARELTPWNPGQTTLMTCHLPEPLGTSSSFYNIGTATSLSNTGGNQAVGWDAGSSVRRQPFWQRGVGTSKQVWSMASETSPDLPVYTANGFFAWERWAVFTRDSAHTDGGYSGTAVSMEMGWSDTTGNPAGNAQDPSAQTNSFYFGCDSSSAPEPDAVLQVCSNDASGSATCGTVKTGWYCRAPEYSYDGFFWASQNEGAIHWFIQRSDAVGGLDSATGTLSNDQPQPTVRLAWHGGCNAGLDAGAATGFTFGLGGVCEWVGY